MFWRKLFGNRLRWAWISSVGLALAAVVEASWHPLASFLCDVPGDPWAVLGLLVLAAAPLLSEHALQADNLKAMRLARCVSGAAWVFWLALFVAIWPAYLLGGMGMVGAPLLALGGLGSKQPWDGALIATFPFLVFTPLVAGVVLLCQHSALRKVELGGLRKPLWWTVFAALCVWGFRPLLLGYHLDAALKATPESREKSLGILRVIGGEYDLRMRSYQRRPTLSAMLAQGGAISAMHYSPTSNAESARRVYFLLTGKPYTEAPVPAPQIGLFEGNDLLKIEEQGGEKVGSKVDGVTLSSSALEARIEETNTARTLWTMTFANSSAEGQEARATIRLPENAVISEAYLWIKGEKRPAAFGGKAQVRAAYEEVVKVQRRDPLLVTMTDPRRALVQCFPVPPKGEMQIQLEITQLLPEAQIALPALTDTNFTQAPALRHRVSVTGDGPEKALALTEAQLLQPAPIPRRETTGLQHKDPPGLENRVPTDLTVAIDTSAGMRSWLVEHKNWLQTLEKSLPEGSTLRFADTRLPRPTVTASLDDALRWRFTGGVDAAPALEALAARKIARQSAIVWVHSPMPAEATDVSSLAALFSQPDAPRLLGVLTAPGPDPVMDALATSKNVWVKDGATPESLVRTATQKATSLGAQTPLGGREIGASRLFAATDPDGRETSLGKLHAWSRTLQGWYEGKSTDTLARYAASRRLVTPISGAVVLETKEQYQHHGLDPTKAPDDPNPQVSSLAPEPGSFLLMLLGIVGIYRNLLRTKR